MNEINALYQKGWETLAKVDGEQGDRVIEALADIAPDVGEYIIRFAFGEIYNRPALDLRQREIATLSALTAIGGCENQLKVHINASLNVGLTQQEIVEVITQCIPYVGFPRVLNAIFVAKDVFASRN